MMDQEEVYEEERKSAYNEALNDVLEFLEGQSRNAKDELIWAKRNGDYTDKTVARREVDVINNFKSEIEKLKRTS